MKNVAQITVQFYDKMSFAEHLINVTKFLTAVLGYRVQETLQLND